MLDVRLFRAPALTTGAAIVFLQFFAAFGVFFLVPQWLQYVHELSPLEAAVALLPMAFGVGPTARCAPVLLRRLGARLLAAWGLTQMAVALALIAAQAGGAPLWLFELTLLLFGTGFGLALAPGTQLVIESLPADRRSVAAAVTDVTRQVGGALGGAVAASVLVGVYAPDLQRLTAGLPGGMAARAGSGVGQALGVAGRLGPRGDALADGARHAFAEGFGTAVLACGGALLLGVAVCRLVVPGGGRWMGPAGPRRVVAVADPGEPGIVSGRPSGRTRLVLV